MTTKIYCTVCGAENDIEQGGPSFCYNCDNELSGKVHITEASQGSVDDMIKRTFACVYFAIFILSTIGFLLSLGDTGSTSSAADLMLLIPMLFHFIWVKWAREITGVYKGKNRYVFLRSIILYSIITLTIYAVITIKNMDSVGLIFLMLFSLILFYSYFFGKKNTGWNYFKFL
ncbi:hypothetical protein [Geobacter sp. AOG1]|uniref:hypothetical protein n=1 Tax=Geobacter sp. AOG1 TaxID=1566346 RepID=UPI001CC77A71|nr:hypothetical protein [Geobacter sp. AOG1]